MPVQSTCSSCGAAFERRYFYGTGKPKFCGTVCSEAGPRPPDPIYSDDGETALIPLVDRAGVVTGHVLVDASDAVFAGRWRWSIDHKGYVRRSERPKGQPKTSIRLHRELLGLPRAFDGREGDHRDRDKLNCRRSNLRVATTAQNLQNKGSYSGARSSFRGVDLYRNGKWRARIRINKKLIHLGYFETEAAAGTAAREARTRMMPYAID